MIRDTRNALAVMLAGCLAVKVVAWITSPLLPLLVLSLLMAVAASWFIPKSK